MNTPYLYKTGWAVIAIIVAIPVIRWFQLNGFNFFGSSFEIFSAVGRLAGLTALAFYAVNFLLSTRIHILDTFFGGLNKAYFAHHLTGGLAFILLLIHPIMLALSFAPDAMSQAYALLVPSLTFPPDWALLFGRLGLFLTLALLFITFYVKMSYEKWLKTHRLMGAAFLFIGIHVYLIPSDVSYDGFLRFYMLGLIAVGLAAFTYRTLLGKVLVRRSEMTVSSVASLPGNATRIEMRITSDRQTFDFTPGQFIFVRFRQKGIRSEFHPFSLTSKPDKMSAVIIAKQVGDFTKSLASLEPGSTAEIEGAFGKFGYKLDPTKHQIWIAGGIGITPYLSLAKNLPEDTSVDLFYAADTRTDLVEYQLLTEIAARNERFTLHTYLSREKTERITSRYIQDRSSGALKDSDILLCGPPAMMKDLKNQFISLGIPKNNLHSEEFALR